MNLAEYLIPAAAGLVSGAIGSLVAPWVQWGIEARRNRAVERKALLAEIRAVLCKPPPLDEFRGLPLYSRVLLLISPKTRTLLEGEFDKGGNATTMIVTGPHGGIDPYAHDVLVDLTSKEKEGGLI